MLYDIVVKPTETAETVNLVQGTVLTPVEDLLTRHGDQTARAVEQLSGPIAKVVANQNLLFSQRVKLTIPHATTAGFLGVLPRLDFNDLFEQLKPADRLLWLDTYCPVIRSAEDSLLKAVMDGAHVQMLAIDPEAQNTAARAAEITEGAFSETLFRNEARSGLQHLRDYAALLDASKTRGSVEVRLYAGLPCIPMYILLREGKPHVGYTSFFLNRATFSEPHIVWGPEGRLGFLERFTMYFEHRWQLAAGEYEQMFLQWPGVNADATSG